MKASLGIEAIGDDTDSLLRSVDRQYGIVGAMPCRAWCAEITGMRGRGYVRRFLHGKKDYTRSNSKGSRGIYWLYLLEAGRIYEVSAPLSWKRHDRYFCWVLPDGTIERITKEVVDAWLTGSEPRSE